MKSGIYEILNTQTGKRYIGSATRLLTRFSTHRNYLRSGRHHSVKLQRSWDKHGESAFEFRPILFCEPADLIMYEQIAFDALAPEYNACARAASTLGHKWSAESLARIANRPNDHFKGRKHSPETLAKMSQAKRGNTATKGKKRSPDAVAKSAAAHCGMKRSAETRARIGAAMRASWAAKSRPG